MEDDKEAVFIRDGVDAVKVDKIAYYRCPAELRDFILKVVAKHGKIVSFHMDEEKYWNIGFGVGETGTINVETGEINIS